MLTRTRVSMYSSQICEIPRLFTIDYVNRPIRNPMPKLPSLLAWAQGIMDTSMSRMGRLCPRVK